MIIDHHIDKPQVSVSLTEGGVHGRNVDLL